MIRLKYEKGEIVRLDAGFAHTSIVEVVSQTPLLMFTTVKSDESEWQVHTDRLSEILKNESERNSVK